MGQTEAHEERDPAFDEAVRSIREGESRPNDATDKDRTGPHPEDRIVH
ncbi:MAG TPA: hypothetical protein VHO23_01675 [Candidatus Paceibacterota bacterium]|nr:hypothetical protein [Candidatus Paceibacterota bacterium]